jgi:hypothetical protein
MGKWIPCEDWILVPRRELSLIDKSSFLVSSSYSFSGENSIMFHVEHYDDLQQVG